MATEEIINMAKLYTPRIDDETIECRGMLFSYGLLIAFIVFVSGALSGLLVCGMGAFVVNTSELVKMGKEK